MLISQKMNETQEIGILNVQDPVVEKLVANPNLITRELNRRSLHHFLQWAWPEISGDPFIDNWHMKLQQELGGERGRCTTC